MRDEALSLAASVADPGRKLNLLREYLQAFTLRALHEEEAFLSLAFVGGTALRFLEGLPRFSEDLNFCLVDEAAYAPLRWLKTLETQLRLAGYQVTIRWNDQKTVNTAWLRFSQLLYQAGIAPRPEEDLSIKLEIDTRPPAGASVKRSVVTRHATFVLCHYTLESLMAGKLHAILSRPYPKGRDWFDLIWYLSHRPPITPNLPLLQNALDQTQGKGSFQARRWPSSVKKKLLEIDVEALAREVSVFLERPADRALLTRENLVAALSAR